MTLNPALQMTREELYNQVWAVPARQLENTLGLHNGAIGKLCKKLGVPKPGRGHWELAKQGLKPERPALSLAAGDTPYEIAPAAFPLPVDFRSAHPLVIRTRKILQAVKPHRWSSISTARIYADQPEYLDVKVSKGALDRALRIMQALIDGLSTKGYTVTVKEKDPTNHRSTWDTYVSIQGEPVQFWLEEPTEIIERTLTPKEMKEGPHSTKSYVPTGRLIFMIKHYRDGARTKWSLPAEDAGVGGMLASFVDGLIDSAKVGRVNRLEYEKRAREYAENTRRINEAEEAIRNLKQNAAAWEQVQKLREFLAAVNVAAIRKSGAVDPTSKLGRWLTWAKSYVDSVDPAERFASA